MMSAHAWLLFWLGDMNVLLLCLFKLVFQSLMDKVESMTGKDNSKVSSSRYVFTGQASEVLV